MHWTDRRRFLRMTLGIGGALALGTSWPDLRSRQSSNAARFERASQALGTKVGMTVLHAERQTAEAALDAAFAEIEQVEEVMSLYRPDSQLCRLNRGHELRDPHTYLVSVLSESQRLAQQSSGAFDVTVQPLWSLYQAAHKSGRLPESEALALARGKVDWRRLEVSPRRVRIDPGMAVTLNGIAQGFAADRALDALRRHGIQHALVDAGELGSLGHNADGRPWTAGIQHPRIEDAYVGVTQLAGRCLATSGDYATSFKEDRSVHHIFDPRTGQSPLEFASVSVLAESGLLADGLSTALFVLGLDRGMELVRSTPGADALFVLKDGRTLATPGFPSHV